MCMIGYLKSEVGLISLYSFIDRENTKGKLTERAPLKDTNKRTTLEMAKQEVL